MNINLIFLLLFIVVFYVFILLPQTKKAKAQKKFREELKKGDKVITTGGIHGKITEIKDLTFIIDAGGNTKLKVDRSAINMEATQLIANGGDDD